MSFQFPISEPSFMHGKLAFLHNGVMSTSAAFDIKKKANIRILLPRSVGVVSVLTEVFDESLSCRVAGFAAPWYSTDSKYDIYESDINIAKIGKGLYFFRIKIVTATGTLFGYKGDEGMYITSECTDGRMFQMSVSSFSYPEPKRKYGGIIYHIFVDRFRRGGEVKCKSSAKLVDNWTTVPEYPAYPGAPLKNNTFYGGTLFGIIEKLDYISSLGVDTIYLSPIFDAASNHKYDTADYMSVDSMFGGEEALVALIKAAKKRKIGIILDGVFNHTGSDSVYFNRYGNYPSIGAYQSKESPYYSWYDFQTYPDKYTCWWGIDILPRINPSISECGRFFVGKGGVVDKYSSMGIDGMRLDVVDELDDEFVSSIKKCLNSNNKSSVLYGEVWEDASNKIAYGKRKKYYLGNELDGVMNYPLRKGIINYLLYSDTGELRYALTDVINNAPARIRNMQMNLLGTHDTERILTVLGAKSAEGRTNEYLSKSRMSDSERETAKRRLKMAYTILATVPGIPAIFYGDEAGLEGYHDPFNRMPYPWGREDCELIDFYRRVGQLRRENTVFRCGEFTLMYLDRDKLIFSRTYETHAFVTFVNNARCDSLLSFSDSSEGLIFGGKVKANSEIRIPAFSAEIFKVQKGTDIIF